MSRSGEPTERLEYAPRLLLVFRVAADAELFPQVLDVVALVAGEDLEVEAQEVLGAEADFLAAGALVDDEELAGEAGVEQRVFSEEVAREERAAVIGAYNLFSVTILSLRSSFS